MQALAAHGSHPLTLLTLVASACTTLPCDSDRSSCTDVADGYECRCLPNFVGTPGPSGAGCTFQGSITTSDGNMVIEVDPSRSVIFKRGQVSQAMDATWNTLNSLSVASQSLEIRVSRCAVVGALVEIV